MMQLFLFILLNAVLFIRPTDVIDRLEGAPIYEFVMLLNLVAGAPALFRQFSPRNLLSSPTSMCVLGLLAAVVLSHVANGDADGAATLGFEFFKIVLYYSLLVSVVDSPYKLHRFLGSVAVLIVAMTSLALLQYHGMLELPSATMVGQLDVDRDTGEFRELTRLCGMGIFNDPNDLSVILIVGMMLCLSRIGQSGAARLLWLLALTLMAYGMALTHSRGGFIAMAVAFMAYMTDRIGAWKAILIVTPLMLGLAFGLGRQMDMDFTDRDDTGQHRIRLWRDGLMQLQRAPVFGIGAGNFVEEAGLVAHNSFVQAYAELGFVGGTLFLAAFAGTMITFFQLRSRPRNNISAPTRRCLLACTVGMFVGMMSLSRNYTLPPYLVLGVASAYLRFAALESPQLVPRFTWAMCGRMLQWSLLFLCLMRIFVGVFAGTG